MQLPNAELAFVDINKLRSYSLDPNHHRGKHKARLFSSVLGFTAADAEELKAILLLAAQQYRTHLRSQELAASLLIISLTKQKSI